MNPSGSKFGNALWSGRGLLKIKNSLYSYPGEPGLSFTLYTETGISVPGMRAVLLPFRKILKMSAKPKFSVTCSLYSSDAKV